MGRLDGKIAIVTGASRGIGAAIVGKLAAEGATVVACARSIESCDGAAMCMKVDVSDSAQVDACVKATIEKFAASDTSAAAEVFVDTTSSCMWNTGKSQSFSLPIEYPVLANDSSFFSGRVRRLVIDHAASP